MKEACRLMGKPTALWAAKGKTVMSKSVMQSAEESYLSRRTSNLHKHHIYFGNPNRRLSEEYGCWCWLTEEEHTGFKGVHHYRELDLLLKCKCQIAFERIYGHEKFMEVFGRNYIDRV